jgi:hypothetical protein
VADRVVADHVALEPEAHTGRQVGRVDDPAHPTVELLELDPVEPPLVEAPCQQVRTRRWSDRAPDAPHQRPLEGLRRDPLDERVDQVLLHSRTGESGLAQHRPARRQQAVGERAARDRRDVPEIRQHPGVGEQPDRAEAGERRPEPAA